MTNSGNILWADDEIDLLKPHILFLESKGYTVQGVTNGLDALEKVQESFFDIVFLDENMPGLSGLDTLTRIQSIAQLHAKLTKFLSVIQSCFIAYQLPGLKVFLKTN